MRAFLPPASTLKLFVAGRSATGPRSFFFFHDTATTEIYTLSLHDALPISRARSSTVRAVRLIRSALIACPRRSPARSEEHTSELQSRSELVCRLLREKTKHHNKQRQGRGRHRPRRGRRRRRRQRQQPYRERHHVFF